MGTHWELKKKKTKPPTPPKKKTMGASHYGLAIYKRQKKKYGNSNISPCKNIPNLQKYSKRNQNP
jgi:hypothetical protein